MFYKYKEWWEYKRYTPLHNSQRVMRVKKALQGHPESPRLWAILIYGIITDLGFQPCTHESCLYIHDYYKGNKVYFITQVDDFAVSAPTVRIGEAIIVAINSKLTVQIKSLGTVNRFNGVDIAQTANFIKVYNNTYIEKILEDKDWLEVHIPGQTSPQYIPMHYDAKYNRMMEGANPIPEKELKIVEKEYGFSYK